VSAQQVVNYRNIKGELCNEKDALIISVNEAQNGLWHRSDYYIQTKKLEKDGYYKDSANTIKHGKFTYFYPNNSLESRIIYQDNQKEGAYLSFYPNGMMRDSFYFKNDIPIGICSGWYPNGSIRAEMQMDSTGTGKGVAIGFFENGNISFKGLLNVGLRKAGNWFYYHENGNKASVLQFPKTDTVAIGKPNIKYDLFETIYYDSTVKIYNALCYNQDGIQQDSCSLINKMPEYKNGVNGWSSYLETKMFDITRTVTGEPGSMNLKYKVYFMIDSKGATSNVMIDNAVENRMDLKVGDVIRDSKFWTPARHNNRIIPFLHTQSMTFMLNTN
jgi:antitoxin component YwqK of YwqJK toxin-antitoxin module